MYMRRIAPFFLSLLLMGCATNWSTPQPAPAVAAWPQEIQHNQTQGLQRIGSASVTVHGGPMDAEEALKARAEQAKADYYLILFNDDTIVPGVRRAQAILYRKH